MALPIEMWPRIPRERYGLSRTKDGGCGGRGVAFVGIVSGVASGARPAITWCLRRPAKGRRLTSNSVSFEFTYTRKPKATTVTICALSGPTSSPGRATPVAFWGEGIAIGQVIQRPRERPYPFTVSLTLTDGGTASATRHFTVAVPVRATVIVYAACRQLCAHQRRRRPICWGANGEGQLGNSRTAQKKLNPGRRVEGSRAGSLRLPPASLHSCAVKQRGRGQVLGQQRLRGSLGNGTTTQSSTPVDVSGLSGGVTCVGAGDGLQLRADERRRGQMLGQQRSGAAGQRDDHEQPDTGQRHPPLRAGWSRSQSAKHSCALTSVDAVKCWGYNHWPAAGGTRTPQICFSTVPVESPGFRAG